MLSINVTSKLQILPPRMHTNAVIRTAIYSRVVVIAIQFIADHLIWDHDAGVFLSPKTEKYQKPFDVLVQETLGGFLRWDAQYFTHIAKYGYTYENALAFFPLYPMLTGIIAHSLWFIFPFGNIDSLVLLVGVLFNSFVFVLASIALYRLSKAILIKEELAFKAAVLFCFNPASVFFSAPYTETVFSYLTFSGMLDVVRIYRNHVHSKKSLNCKDDLYIIPISMSTCTRSNGILNIGFLTYFLVCFYYYKLVNSRLQFKRLFFFTFNICIFLIVNVAICLIPFILYQIYAYNLFCKDFKTSLPENVVVYGLKNDLILPGTFSQHNQTWCYQNLPFSYSYIQDHYWNVGFLRYYTIKQLPNFLLALPITFLILKCSYQFFRHYPNILCNPFFSDERSEKFLPRGTFVFVVHALFLAVFNFLCTHVQVTTRMICSASPVLYWYCAFVLKDVPLSEFLKFRNNIVNLSGYQMFVKCYFVTYFVVGIVLFCNFLPWT